MEWLKRVCREYIPKSEVVQLLVSIASICVAIVALCVSCNANKIMERQMEVEKADKKPLINLEMTYDEDVNGNAIGHNLIIHNEGGLMKNFDSEVLTLLEIEVLDYSKDNAKKLISLPIKDYYDIPITTGALQKKIVTHDNLSFKEGNNWRIFNVSTNFLSVVKPFEQQKEKETGKVFSIGVAELKTYSKVEYEDIYGDKHVEYYEVDTFGAKRLSNSKGKEIFKTDILSKEVLSIRDINENKLLELVKEKVSK
ncbi:hypothetical protein JCR32_02845 [Bacillus sp. HNR-4]|uniref:hypothetical protein n=1 Tax=Bacillus sp. HNR-4 TaxID=2796141 RepID=UPI00237A087F|nr:hypothetical protein [Bacillus sp. HNR-4]WDL92800.1 hypothetical protein JCR32_02845 [Bacillus sp. HNR-4]